MAETHTSFTSSASNRTMQLFPNISSRAIKVFSSSMCRVDIVISQRNMISCVSSTQPAHQPHPGPSNTDFHTPAMCHSVTTISHVVSSSSMSPLSTLPSSHHIVHHTHHHIDWQQSSQQSPVKFQARDLHCRSTQRNSVVFSVYKNQTLFYFNHLMFMLSHMVYRLRAQSFVCLFCVCTSLTQWSMTL